ncbi:MAG: hypothetical protein OSB57_01740 [Planctomycetota bacterium]|nr:hypothetical protein [Planctomycetota bacterium]
MDEIQNFFITGYPRSRTTWISNWLTTDRSLCLHDATRFCHDIDDLVGVLRCADVEHVGNCDSNLTLHLDRVRELFPDAPIVVIDRDVQEVEVSLRSAGFDIPGLRGAGAGADADADAVGLVMDALRPAMEAAKLRDDVLTLPYESLAESSTCRRITDYCTPGLIFNEWRWRQLDEMRVVPQVDRYKQNQRGGRSPFAHAEFELSADN